MITSNEDSANWMWLTFYYKQTQGNEIKLSTQSLLAPSTAWRLLKLLIQKNNKNKQPLPTLTAIPSEKVTGQFKKSALNDNHTKFHKKHGEVYRISEDKHICF